MKGKRQKKRHAQLQPWMGKPDSADVVRVSVLKLTIKTQRFQTTKRRGKAALSSDGTIVLDSRSIWGQLSRPRLGADQRRGGHGRKPPGN